ncbi:MAG: hypothetical protein H7Y61_04075 [Rhizobiales bacterium]|nr:hypothetical protein [Rhizobacter sp.]
MHAGTTLAQSEAPVASEVTPAYTLTGNVGVVSDYRFRGVSNTHRRPALQAGLEASHTASGLYGGIWGSNVANAAFNGTQGYEFDAYGGWRTALNEQWQLDAGLATYWFPGAAISVAQPSGVNATVRYHTQELKLGLNSGSFNVTGWYSVGRYWSGFYRTDSLGNVRDVRGTRYLEVNWNPDLGNGVTLNLHVGTQRFRGLSAANFNDIRAGVTKAFGAEWQLSAAVIHNDGDRAVWTFIDPRDNSARYAAGTTLVLGVQRNF